MIAARGGPAPSSLTYPPSHLTALTRLSPIASGVMDTPQTLQ